MLEDDFFLRSLEVYMAEKHHLEKEQNLGQCPFIQKYKQ